MPNDAAPKPPFRTMAEIIEEAHALSTSLPAETLHLFLAVASGRVRQIGREAAPLVAEGLLEPQAEAALTARGKAVARVFGVELPPRPNLRIVR